MKFLTFFLISLFFVTNVFANVKVSMTCSVDDYRVDISENVNENLENPLSVVQVFQNDVEVYRELYKIKYTTSGKLEVWEYEGFLHSSGVVGIAATSANKGKADIYIDLNEEDAVDGSSVDCVIWR